VCSCLTKSLLLLFMGEFHVLLHARIGYILYIYIYACGKTRLYRPRQEYAKNVVIVVFVLATTMR
jgi:hypothetical protein